MPRAYIELRSPPFIKAHEPSLCTDGAAEIRRFILLRYIIYFEWLLSFTIILFILAFSVR